MFPIHFLSVDVFQCSQECSLTKNADTEITCSNLDMVVTITNTLMPENGQKSTTVKVTVSNIIGCKESRFTAYHSGTL